MASDSGNQELDLAKFLAALRRRRVTIAVVAVAMSASALVFSLLQTPVYQGEVRIALDPAGGTAVFEPVESQARIEPALVIDTEIELLKSDRVRVAVREALGPVDDVKASRVGDTLLINVNGYSTDPQRAAAVTNAYARNYIELRRQQASDELLDATSQMRASVAGLQEQIDTIDPDASPEQRQALVQQHARFSERLDQLQIEAALESGGAQIVGESEVPTDPVAPTPVRDAALGLVVGAMLGLGLALVLEYRDDSIKTKDDLAEVIESLPVLGTIPTVPAWRQSKLGRHNPRVVTGDGTANRAAGEAYRGLRTAVRLLGVERPLTMIQVTSPLPGEGKTTTLANLAVVLVAAGQRVVMVDCDLRRPSLHSAFGLDNHVGFTSVLAGEADLATALQRVPGTPDLALLASGALPPNPSELLGAKRASQLLFSLRADFDMILLDCPPVLSVTDAAVLSVWVDATLLLTTAGLTRRSQVREAVEVLRQAEAPLSGAVLNQVAAHEGYGDYYVDAEDDRGRGRRRERPVPKPVPAAGRSRRPGPAPTRAKAGLFDRQRGG